MTRSSTRHPGPRSDGIAVISLPLPGSAVKAHRRSRSGRSWPRAPARDRGPAPLPSSAGEALLDGDLGALGLELLPGLVRRLLVDLLQDRLGGRLDQVLGLLQAQPGEGPDHLDDLDLLASVGLQDDVELVLLRLGRLGAGRAAGGRHHGRGRVGGHVEGLLELLHELGELHQGHLLEALQQFLGAQLRHVGSLSLTPLVSRRTRRQAPSSCRFSCSAAASRAVLLSGAWNSAAALLRFAFIAPASLASSTSRGSRSASWRTSSALIRRPSNTPPLITSAGCARPKSRRLRAASTGSPETNASAVGPANSSASPSMPACSAARFASVFLVTAYAAPLPNCRRSVFSSAAVSPR